MADFFISYSSGERDRAVRVADSFRESGHSVWMDSATGKAVDGPDLPGIPGGQQHWSTIRSAIDEASTFLVLETEAWHASAYCAREYGYARSVGKRIAVLGGPAGTTPLDVFARGPEDDPASLLPQLASGDEAAIRHARLVSELNQSDGERPRISQAQLKDAEFLSTAPLPQLGMATNSALHARIVSLLRISQRRRRQVRAATAAVLAVLVALVTVAVIARQQASDNSAIAGERANYSTSLQLAQQAIQAQTTADSLQLAQRGVALNDNDATRAALKAVQASAYRSTTMIPPGTSAAAAVSDDGRAALVLQGSSLYVVDATAGKASAVPLNVGLSRKLAISPNGQMGYVLDASGALDCIDVTDQRMTGTIQKDVVAFSIDPQGTVWWLGRDGTLFRSEACRGDAATPVATGIGSVVALLVASSPGRLYTLTAGGSVEVHELPAASGPIGPLLNKTDLTKVPLDGHYPATDKPDLTTTNAFTRCGDSIHVVAGFVAPLHASAHVAFSLDGNPTSPRTMNTEMVGIGCAPNGQAWATPTLYGHPLALPSSGVYPANEIDERDHQSRTVIANSPASNRTIVVHSDGRVDVFSVADEQWAEAMNQGAVAVPLSEGTVVVDTDGTTKIVSKTGTATLGNLGASPVPETGATSDTAYVAAGDKVFAITARGITPSGPLPGAVHSVVLSPRGESVVVNGSDFVAELAADLSGAARKLALPKLRHDEMFSSITLDGSQEILATSYGRVLVADRSGGVLAEASTGVAGMTTARPLPDHSIVVVGGNGMLSKYSPDMKLTSSHLFGPMAVGLQASQDGRVLLVSLSGNFSVWAVDSATMQPIIKVATRVSDFRLINVSADGRTVVQLLPKGVSNTDPAQIVRTQL